MRQTTPPLVVIMSWIILGSVCAASLWAAEPPMVLRPATEHDRAHPKPTAQHTQTVTGSSVNHLTRSYTTDGPSLSVNVPGGFLDINTSYNHGAWAIGPAGSGFDGKASTRGALGFTMICQDTATPIVSAITKDGTYTYSLPAANIRQRTTTDANGHLTGQTCEYVGEPVYFQEGKKLNFTIKKTAAGYRWEDKSGNWMLYADNADPAASGRLLAAGDRRGVTTQPLYDQAQKLVGYADRNGQQVIWFDYQDGQISTVRDASGNSITYTYNTEGRLGKIKDVAGVETIYTYYADGKLRQISKPDGQEVHLTYNDAGEVASVLDAHGKGYVFEFDYDKTKKEYYALVRSTSGEIKEYWYDETGDTKRMDVNGKTVQTITKDGRALIITDASGLATREEYDEWDNLTKVVYPDGAEDHYEYEHTYQQLLRKTERGVITEYTYAPDGKLTMLVEAKGTATERVTEYTYNTAGNRTKMRLTEAAGTALAVTTIEDYDDAGNRTTLTEAAGTDLERVTAYAYTDGKLTRLTKYLDGGATAVTEMRYSVDGNLIWQRDPSGQETSYTYADGNIKTVQTSQGTWTYGYTGDRVTSVTDPFGQSRSQAYDADGNVQTVTVNGNTVATYTYTNGHLTQRTDAAGNVSAFEYDANGQLTRQLDPEQREQRYTYDTHGRLWQTIDGNSNAIVREYGSIGTTGSGSTCTTCSSSSSVERLLKITYPTFTKAFQYDADGRVSAEIYTLSTGDTRTVSYTYDALGRLKTTTSPDNQTMTYTYDRLGRRVQVDDPSGSTKFEYDRWDNLIALVDANNQRTAFEYAHDGKLNKEIRPLLQETQYTYDAQGRVWKILDAKGQTTEYGYEQGKLKTIRYAGGKTVTLSYDGDGNLAGYSDCTDALRCVSATYTYDAVGRKLSETVNYGPFSKRFSYTYYKNGLKQTFTAPDGTMYTYRYGLNNELKEVQMPGVGSITMPDYTWNRPRSMLFPGGTRRTAIYDAFMRIQTLTITDPAGNPLLNYAYTYDSIGNITAKATEHGNYVYGYDRSSRLVSADNPVLADESYTYDHVGNRQTASGVSGSITHNANNELLVYGDTAYTYDANGNLTQKNVGTAAVNYLYNAENRLVKVEDDLTKTVIAEYGYDPFGRRLWKDVQGVKTYFFYSEEGLIAEYDANGVEIRSYGYQPDSTWTTDPLWLKQGGQYYFYQNDHLGTPQKLVAQNGAVVWAAMYEAFGNAHVEVETITNNLRFPGQYYDAETGLHYNFQRYYNPKLGRYLRKDPLGVTVETNLFVYVKNRPINYFDDLGLKIQGFQIIRGHFSEGAYGWDYQYHQDGCSVTIRIKLVDRTPFFYLNDSIINTWRYRRDNIIKTWESGIEEKWSNKFACCDPDGFTSNRICCKGYCIITVDVQFVTSEEDVIVYVHHGTSIEYPGHPCHPSVYNWCTTTPGDVAAHEIGHQLGLGDEYLDLGMAPKRYPVNTGTVMDVSSGTAVLRHFRDICRNVGKVPTTLRGSGLP